MSTLPFVESPSTDFRCNASLRGATDCTSVHSRAARGIWKDKTAEHWAAEAGVKVRAAKYWLAGRQCSAAGKIALIRLLA